ncbi:MAG: DUF4340 domain-containing protein [Steroidobacteraceae bacterium]
MTGGKAKQVIAAAVVLAVLVAAALWVGMRDRADKVVSSLLYPGLAEQIKNAERVQVFTAGDQLALDLTRSGDRWSVAQRDGYAADVGKIGVLLQNIAELKVLEAKTSDPANYATVGVEDPASPNAQGARVLITGPGNTALVNLVVGKSASGLEATYVRKAGEAGSWLVNRLPLTRTPGAWISPLVFHVDTDRVHQATIRIAGKPDVTVTRAERATPDFAATGKPLSTPSAANGVAAGLIAVEADDVRKSAALTALPVAARATYKMFDGLELELTGWNIDGNDWIAVAPSFNAELAARYANDKPPENNNTAFWRTPEQARQEAERLGERVNGWAFRIPSYRYDGIFPNAENWRR